MVDDTISPNWPQHNWFEKAEFRDATPYWLRLFLHNGEEFEEDTP